MNEITKQSERVKNAGNTSCRHSATPLINFIKIKVMDNLIIIVHVEAGWDM